MLGRLRTVLKERIAQLPQRQRLAQLDADGKALRNWFSDETRVPSFAALMRALVKLHDAECWRLVATVMAAQAAKLEGVLPIGVAMDEENLAEAESDVHVRRASERPTPENLAAAAEKVIRQAGHAFRVLHAIEHTRPMGCR